MKITMTSFITAFFIILVSFPALAANEKESAFDRVMRTGQLRCGYGTGAPLIVVDPNTKEISGIAYDLVEEMGKALNIEIVWAEEVSWGSLSAALRSGRVDAICSTVWASPSRGKSMAFTRPVFYSTVEAFARIDDKRFDNSLDRMNQPDVRIAVAEGDVTEEIANLDFPKATQAVHPQLAGDEYIFMSLIENKADILFLNTAHMIDFMKKRPGTIRKIPLPRPLRVWKNTFAVEIHEQELKDMLDTTVDQLLNTGMVDRLIKKYEPEFPGVFLPVARPYEYGAQK